MNMCSCYSSNWASQVVKNPPANAGDVTDAGSIPGLARSPGGGHCNPLQYSCLENPMDRGAWRATIHRVAQSWTRLKQPSTHTYTNHYNLLLKTLEVRWWWSQSNLSAHDATQNCTLTKKISLFSHSKKVKINQHFQKEPGKLKQSLWAVT